MLIMVNIVMIIVILTAIGMYYWGKGQWGKIDVSNKARIALKYYIKLVNFKLLFNKQSKIAIMLHLLLVHEHIVAYDPDYAAAQNTLEGKTEIRLIDIYDDLRGKRYLKLQDKKVGFLIIEIKDYFNIILNRRYSEGIVNTIKERNDESLKEYEKKIDKKPVLKVVK